MAYDIEIRQADGQIIYNPTEHKNLLRFLFAGPVAATGSMSFPGTQRTNPTLPNYVVFLNYFQGAYADIDWDWNETSKTFTWTASRGFYLIVTASK